MFSFFLVIIKKKICSKGGNDMVLNFKIPRLYLIGFTFKYILNT